jgi:riboflavin synthase
VFTGIVEAACPVLSVTDAAGGTPGPAGARRLTLDLRPLRDAPGARSLPSAGALPGPARAPAAEPAPAAPPPLVHLGDSVAVNGCCLTVAALAADRAAFDVVPETLACTGLDALAAGARVNVERSLRYGDPLDGHLVSGHVERTGRVLAVQALPGERRLTLECGPDFAARTLPKGSVAVDGVSLTVAEVHADRLVVALVPHTLERTTLGALREGDRVNLEADLLGQWVLAAVSRLPR